MNEFLTVYLRTLNTLSGGQMSPSRAMDRLIDLVTAAQSAKTAVGKLLKLDGQGAASGRHGHA
jgi:hypothetical protein